MQTVAVPEYTSKPNGMVPQHYAQSFGLALNILGDELFAERRRTARLDAALADASDRCVALQGEIDRRNEWSLLRRLKWALWRR